MVELVQLYKSRKVDEDLFYLVDKLGGINDVALKMNVDLEKGLDTNNENDL